MTSPLDQVCGASLPRSALAVLADLRGLPDVGVTLAGERAWVRWPAGDEEVLRRLLPVPGVELYEQREQHWYRHGQLLPSFGLPLDAAGQPLRQALTPEPARPESLARYEPRRCPLRLVRDDQPRGASALRGGLAQLAKWAETATTAQLAALAAARCGGQVVLLGAPLPPLPDAERFWGERILVPLGMRPEPALPEAALAEVLGVKEDDLLVLGSGGAELLSRKLLQRLTRTGIRLAQREATP